MLHAAREYHNGCEMWHVYNLDGALEEMGWSRAELARRLGVDRNTVAKWRESVPGYVCAYFAAHTSNPSSWVSSEGRVFVQEWRDGRWHCGICGRPFPLSAAERQRRYRERKRENATQER